MAAADADGGPVLPLVDAPREPTGSRSVPEGDAPAWRKPGCRALAVAVAVVALVVAGVWSVSEARLPGVPSFVVLVAALVSCFDVLSVVLLVGQFRDTGDLRILALSWAYVLPLLLLAGWAAAFPGVWGPVGPLGYAPSTAAWLWVAWHTAFPVLLAVALVPWPVRQSLVVGRRWRRPVAWGSVTGAALLGAAVVTAVAEAGPDLPVIIHGDDSGAMTRLTAPVMVPVVLAAATVATAGAWRRAGPERWAALAAVATAADVALTLSSRYRYSVGWYTGRTLSILAAAVVLVAMISRFRRLRRHADADADQLRRLLTEGGRLERLQTTLLDHMTEGVVMQDATGRVLSSNPTARRMLALPADQLHGRRPIDPRWQTLRPDGTPWGHQDRPSAVTVRTRRPVTGQILGVRDGDGDLRWLSVTTSPALAPTGAVEYVVTSMRDITTLHATTLADQQATNARQHRIQQLLDGAGPTMVVQPILQLATGALVGVEALARFPDGTPDAWFADAAAAGLGVELELAAIRAALSLLDRLPAHAYLSINASPATITNPDLLQLLRQAPTERLVLELTEHTAITDYDALAAPLNRLRWSGVRLAVDDAGSGYASLQHILNISPDIIKLDRALVADIDTDPARASLTSSLITFAQRIGADLVAEGIENAPEHHALQHLGIRYGQGFHLARPMPARSLPDYPHPHPHPQPAPQPASPATDRRRPPTGQTTQTSPRHS